MMKGLEVRFLSATDELLSIVNDSSDTGAILNLKVTEKVNGGVSSFSFSLSRDAQIPLAKKTNCLLLIDGERWFSGYIDTLPEPDQDSPVLEIEGLGHANLLAGITVNEAFTASTLSDIVATVLSTYLDGDIDVYYDAAKISMPTLTDIDIEFADSTLLDFMSWIIKVCNYDYATTKYRWYIDDERDLVIAEYGSDVEQTLFEGYQYQTPDVSSSDDSLLNSLLCYRADAEDSDTLEYVTTVQDTESISNNGKQEEKLTFPYNIDDDTIENMASAIIAIRAEKEKKVELDLLVSAPAPFGLYKIANRRKNYWVDIDSGESLDNWDTSTLTGATVSVDTAHALTGKRALLIDFTSSASGYIFHELDTKIALPSIIRMFAYVGSVGVTAEVRFYDDSGSFASIDIADTLVDQWVKAEKTIPLGTSEGFMCVDYDASTEEDLYVNYDETTEGQLEIKTDIASTIRNVSRIEVYISASAAGSIWFDDFACYANVYKTSKLLLEEASYVLSSTIKEASCSFGDQPPSLISSISDEVSSGSAALAVLAKS